MSKSTSANRPEKLTIISTLKYIYKENGIKGLYRGVTPRIGLGIWQTVCMVSFADYVKAWYVTFFSSYQGASVPSLFVLVLICCYVSCVSHKQGEGEVI